MITITITITRFIHVIGDYRLHCDNDNKRSVQCMDYNQFQIIDLLIAGISSYMKSL